MNNSFSRYSEQVNRQIAMIKQIILKVVDAEKIILFGGRIYEADSSYCFNELDLSTFFNQFEFLVILLNSSPKQDVELLDKIEQRCAKVTRITAIVHDAVYINEELSKGSLFFSSILKEGVIIHDAGRVVFPQITSTNLKEVLRVAESDYARWGRQARAFLLSAEYMRTVNEIRVALFLLHQATESIYTAILLIHRGYKPTTHNIDKLRRYALSVSIKLAMVFDLNRNEENHLFRILQSAYVDARYREAFEVTYDELDELLNKVRLLLALSDAIWINRFHALSKRSGRPSIYEIK